MSSMHSCRPLYFSPVIYHSSALSPPHLPSAFIKLPSDCLSPLIVRFWHLFALCTFLTYAAPIISLCHHGDPVCLCKSCHRFSAGKSSGQQGAFSWQFPPHEKVSIRKEQSSGNTLETFTFSESIKSSCRKQLWAKSYCSWLVGFHYRLYERRAVYV